MPENPTTRSTWLKRFRERRANRRALRAERRLRPHDYGESARRAQGDQFRKGGYGGGG